MRVCLTLAAAAIFVVPTIARAEADGPTLLARFSNGTEPTRTLFLYCEQDVKGVHVLLNNRWVEASQEDYSHDGKQYNAYRVSQRLDPAQAGKLSVISWAATGKETFRHELDVKSADGDFVVEVTFKDARSREEYVAEKKQNEEKRYADPYGFIVLLTSIGRRGG